jgi:arabinan endo-1,5-alpha-L-arabinosidase
MASPVVKRADFAPVMDADFPDPAVFHLTDGSWVAYATNRNGHNVQVATSPDFTTWTLQSSTDAMPTVPAWVKADSPAVWAPDVQQLV